MAYFTHRITNMKEKIETMKKRMDELKEIQKKMEQTDTKEISLTDPEVVRAVFCLFLRCMIHSSHSIIRLHE